MLIKVNGKTIPFPLYRWFPQRNLSQRPRRQLVCVEKRKQVTYRKQVIFHQDARDNNDYVFENVTDQQAKVRVLQKYGETVVYCKKAPSLILIKVGQ